MLITEKWVYWIERDNVVRRNWNTELSIEMFPTIVYNMTLYRQKILEIKYRSLWEQLSRSPPRCDPEKEYIRFERAEDKDKADILMKKLKKEIPENLIIRTYEV